MNKNFGPQFSSLDDAFVHLLASLDEAAETQVSPRGMTTKELAPFAFSITNPRRRYLSVPERRWSPAYAIGELAWHLRGSDSVDEIAFYAPRWRSFAAGRSQVEGSCYGAKIFCESDGAPSQWEQILSLLRTDPDSRRAVLYFGSPSHSVEDPTADIACATTLQLLLRNNKLHAVCVMRSNDAVLGLPHDVFLFTSLQELMASEIRVELGTYYHVAGSMHLYAEHFELARRVKRSCGRLEAPLPKIEVGAGLSAFLAGEAALREIGGGAVSQVPGSWGSYLAVLEAWCAFKSGVRAAVSDTCDPVLAALFNQWASSTVSTLPSSARDARCGTRDE